jgi:hypothetical protein
VSLRIQDPDGFLETAADQPNRLKEFRVVSDQRRGVICVLMAVRNEVRRELTLLSDRSPATLPLSLRSAPCTLLKYGRGVAHDHWWGNFTRSLTASDSVSA